MKTPTTPNGLKMYDHLDAAEAVVKAWTIQGNYPYWHAKQKRELRVSMPLLARALDRLVVTHKDNS